jgi:transposase
MPAKYENLRNYFFNRFPDCKITVIYEAGFRGFNLYDSLTGDGWNCVVTPPHTVTQEKCTSQKNDRIDCRRLAKNLENKDYKSCYVHDKQLREDRQISRLYRQIQNNIVRTCNQIRRALEFHGLDEQFSPGRWTEKQYRVLAGSLDRFDITESLRYCLEMMLNELAGLRKIKKEVTAKLRALARQERYQEGVEILTSVPGIGILTAIRLALEWGNMKRFKRKEQFANFTGLIPSEHSTGETEHKGHITKQGNRGVRSWLVESSWIAIRKDPVLLGKFNAVLRNSGSQKKAIVAVARKLAIRIRALLLTGQKYEICLIESLPDG